MNLRKIIAICMIILSVFLQVSYAVSNSEQINSSSDKFRVRFSSIQYDISDKFDIAKISIKNKDDTSIGINVDNIYPGIYYNINTVLENTGSQSIKVTGISLLSSKNKNDDSDRLYDMIVGLKEGKIKLKLDSYISYLNSRYIGKIIKSNEGLALNLSMGMDEEITDLQNTSCEYQIVINFEQSEKDKDDDKGDDKDDGEGSDKGNEGDKGKDDSKGNKDESRKNDEEIVCSTENSEDDIVKIIPDDEKVAGYLSLINVLPESGEKFPISLYISGLALMIGGIFLLKKETKAGSIKF